MAVTRGSRNAWFTLPGAMPTDRSGSGGGRQAEIGGTGRVQPEPSASPRPLRHPAGPRTALALVAIALLFCAHAAIYHGWIEDDAFITFRYARHLVQGAGLVFNPGERLEGYSNFAWVLVSAAALKFGAAPEVVARLLGLLAGLGALLLSWRLARLMLPNGGRAALLAPGLLAFSPVLTRHCVNGLETGAYACAVTGALCLAARRRAAADGGERPGRIANVGLAALLLLLTLLRPEGVLPALAIGIWAFRPRVAPAPLAALLLFFAYTTWRWVYFGTPLSNTFRFKMTGGGRAAWDGLNYSLDFLRHNGGAALVALTLAPLLRPPVMHVWRLAAAVVALQAGVAIAAGGDWMMHYRFFAPVLPTLAAAAAAGLGVLAGGGDAWPRGQRRLLRIVLAAGLLAAGSGIYKNEREVMRVVLPALDTDLYLAQGYRRVGLWLRENTPPAGTVAISDVGAVGWYGERPILDMFGLTDAQIVRRPGRVHFKTDPAGVLARVPEFVVLVPAVDVCGNLTFMRLPDRELYALPAFQADYRLVQKIELGWADEQAFIYRRTVPWRRGRRDHGRRGERRPDRRGPGLHAD